MRMNFVCHGLMWLVEDGDSIEILLPEIAVHRCKHGEPDFRLHSIDPGVDWTLKGVKSSRKSLMDLVCPLDALVLRKSSFAVDSVAARNRIRVPKPDRIRNFRAAEVGASIFGVTPTATAHRIPAVSHDATCLSYHNFEPGESIRFTSSGATLEPRPNPVAVNWCLYSQPENVEPVGHPVPEMNRLLRHSGTAIHPDFQLSFGTPSDRPHVVARQVGLSETHLMTLLELANPGTLPETDRSGCHKAFIAD